jgi:tetratricopeptide (TPR) repeat protein
LYGRGARIRRESSYLGDGRMFGRKRRTWRFYFYIGWAMLMALPGLAMLQYDNVQPVVLEMLGAAPTPTPTTGEYTRRGDAAYWEGNLAAAVENYRAAARTAPNDVTSLYRLALMLIYRSYNGVREEVVDVPEALRVAEQAIAVDPNNTYAHGINCYALLRAGRADAAVQSCLRALELDPNNSDAHAFLSSAYYDLGRYELAMTEAQRAIELNPSSIDGHTAYAWSLAFQGRVETSLNHFKIAAQQNPRLEFPYFNMAFYAYAVGNNGDVGKYNIAINAYNAVLAMNPNSAKAYTRLCETNIAQESDPVTTRAYCERATELDPAYSLAWRWLGEAYHRSRNYESAIEALRECQNLERDLPLELRTETCWWLYGADLFILGDCDSAFAVLTELLTWADEPLSIAQADIVINKCALQGDYKTPTPIPTNTPRPTPIL